MASVAVRHGRIVASRPTRHRGAASPARRALTEDFDIATLTLRRGGVPVDVAQDLSLGVCWAIGVVRRQRILTAGLAEVLRRLVAVHLADLLNGVCGSRRTKATLRVEAPVGPIMSPGS